MEFKDLDEAQAEVKKWSKEDGVTPRTFVEKVDKAFMYELKHRDRRDILNFLEKVAVSVPVSKIQETEQSVAVLNKSLCGIQDKSLTLAQESMSQVDTAQASVVTADIIMPPSKQAKSKILQLPRGARSV